MNAGFRYEEMTGRNRGFIAEAEQQRLRETPVFVCGVGAWGLRCRRWCGPASRAAVDRRFRPLRGVKLQPPAVFATLTSAGQEKTDAVAARAARHQPRARPARLRSGVDRRAGCDSRHPPRGHQRHGRHRRRHSPVSPRPRARGHRDRRLQRAAPSVFVTRPGDPRPEQRLGYPTRDTAWDRLTVAQITACKLAGGVVRHGPFVLRPALDLGVAARDVRGPEAARLRLRRW